MELSSTLLKKFAALTNDSGSTSTGNTVYGTVVVNDEGTYAMLDGASTLTAISEATDVRDGDRVLVSIENHVATVVGNITCPASGRTATEVEADLVAYKAEITELTADYITVGELDATYIRADELEATVATFGYVTAEEIDADYIRADELEAEIATFGYVKADEIDTYILNADYLTADSAVITDLTAEVANINSLLAGNIGAGTVQAVHLTSENVVIDDAVITDAMIVDLTASKLTAGTIYTSLITIQTAEGDRSLYVTDSLIAMYDSNDTQRLQAGMAYEDEGYNFVIWDADGAELFNATGVTASGIPSETIVNDHVAENAAISGTKLDISSVAERLNEDGSLTVDAAQVTIDDTTLEYRLTSITTATDEAVAAAQAAEEMAAALESEAVSSLTQYYAVGDSADEPPSLPEDGNWSTEYPTLSDGDYLWTAFYIVYVDESAEWTTPTCLSDGVARSSTATLQSELEVVQGQITEKVWLTDIEDATDELGNEITSLQDQYSSLTLTVDGITSEVADINTVVSDNYETLTERIATVEQTADGITSTVSDVQTQLNNLSVGGRNYVLNSGGYSDGGDTSYWVVSNDTITTNWTVTQYDGYTRWLCETAESGTTVRVVYLPLSDDFDPTVDHIVTIRMRLSTAMAVYFYGRYLNSSGSYSNRAVNSDFTSSSFTSGEWTDISFTLAGQDSYDYEYFGFGITYLKVSAGVSMDIAHIKIEQGTVATDWTPAPEDTDTAITSATTILSSQITQTASEIASTVSAIQTEFDLVLENRNYALQSGNYTAGDDPAWYLGSTAAESYYTISVEDGYTRIYCDTTCSTTYYVWLDLSADFDSSVSYSISLKVRLSDAAALSLRSYYKTSSGTTYSNGNIYSFGASYFTAGEWVTLSRAWTPTSTSTYSRIGFSFANIKTAGCYLDIAYVMVEQGDTVHSWEPAPEDGASLSYAMSQIKQLSDSIELCVMTDSDTGYLRLGTGEDDTVKFTIEADNITFDEDGNLEITGTVNAIGGTIGGWSINDAKIYGGTTDTGVAVMQMPTEDTTYVFAAGPSEDGHDSYKTCPFRVTKDGTLVSEKGKIGDWNINGYKIYGGTAATDDDEGTRVAVMQRPTEDTLYVFAAGGTSHESYADCPFRVDKYGKTYTDRLTVGENLYVQTGGAALGNNYGVYHYNTSGTYVHLEYLNTSDQFIVGNSSYATYLYGSSITSSKSITTSSDARLKTDILALADAHETLFNNLQPCMFRYSAEENGALHLGFTVQDIESAMEAAGLTPEDYALTSWGADPESGEVYGALAYDEIIALLVDQVQRLKSRVTALEAA